MFEKKNGGPNLVLTGQNQAQNDQMFSLKLHTTIACDNIYHLVEAKSTKKKFGAQMGPRRPKSGPKLCFSPLSQVWFTNFALNCIG